jgi:enoyl-CoA hydratase/carnithine racemase
MDSPFIITEQRDSLSFVRLHHPEKLNALSREMILALSDIFNDLDHQQKLRAVILTGTGDKAFCAGPNINELASFEFSAADVSEPGQALCDQIENCGVPVIAAVNGIAAGIGCELALACHLRIASVTAQFSFHETSRLTRRLERELGKGRALEMMQTAKSVSAEEALQFGLINRVAPAADLLREAEYLAREIAQLAPLAIRACLQAVTQGTQLSLAEGLALETKLFASLFATDDVREGTCAFLEKRSPVFKGS